MKKIIIVLFLIISFSSIGFGENCFKFYVETFSAPNQNFYDACETAKGLAIAEIGRFINYTKFTIKEQIKKGKLNINTIDLDSYGRINSVFFESPKCFNLKKVGECCYDENNKFAITRGIVFYKIVDNNIIVLNKKCNNPINQTYSKNSVMPENIKPVMHTKNYDSLIIDVSKTNFEPSPGNEVVDENNNKIFGIDIVKPEFLSKKIPCGYMTNLNDAKLLLKSWGAKSPFIIKAKEIKNRVKVIISAQDYIKLYSYIEKDNFLSKGNIVFLMGN